MSWGYCDNPKSYYFATEVEEDFEPEECGLRKCKHCPHFISKDQLDDIVHSMIERERERLERLFGF